MRNGWCGGVSQDHGRAQNSSHCNHVVAFVGFDCGLNHMHVREWQCCICPAVTSWIPTHLLNEHLFVFGVLPHAPRGKSNLRVCAAAVWVSLDILSAEDITCATYDFAIAVMKSRFS